MKTFDHVALTPIEMETITIDGKRYYVTPTGNNHPSVTTVISNNSKKVASINKWRNRVGKEKAQSISNKAATKGTRYHKLVEDYLNNELDLEIYQDQPLPVYMFHSSKDILDRINNIYLQEAALYSDRLSIAGRVDCIAEFDGDLSIIDFKTSIKPKKEEYMYDYFVQECAYACMLQECYGISVKKLVTIVSCQDGSTQVSEQNPKKEYFLKLMEYIQEYRENNAKKSGG